MERRAMMGLNHVIALLAAVLSVPHQWQHDEAACQHGCKVLYFHDIMFLVNSCVKRKINHFV